jgi:hypothetical protein
MPKDPERQRHLAARLQASEVRVGWLSDAPLSDKLDSWLGQLFGQPSQPWGLVLIDADGTRRVIDPPVPLWVLPSVLLALGAGLGLATGDLVSAALFASGAVFSYVQQARAERHLLFDATRRLAIVHRGRRVLVEIPFDDIDAIFVEVKADPSYGDKLRALASIGAASLPLTMWTTDDDATAAADAVARITGAVRHRKPRRLTPET